MRYHCRVMSDDYRARPVSYDIRLWGHRVKNDGSLGERHLDYVWAWD